MERIRVQTAPGNLHVRRLPNLPNLLESVQSRHGLLQRKRYRATPAARPNPAPIVVPPIMARQPEEQCRHSRVLATLPERENVWAPVPQPGSRSDFPHGCWYHERRDILSEFGITIDAFIDGQSRFITSIRASPNQPASNILRVFMHGAADVGMVPSKVKGGKKGNGMSVTDWVRWVKAESSYEWKRSASLCQSD